VTASPEFLDTFEQLRPRLFGIAYRMLGDAHEAEDLVQECYLRWHEADHVAIIAPEGWLVTVMTRLAIDRLHRAERERLSYVGHWLPEPIATGDDAGTSWAPDVRVERESDLSIAFLMLLERLGPEERAAFLLRELFDTEYDEIARIIDRTPAAARQMVHRARERIRDERARFTVPPDAQQRLLDRFLAAVEQGDQEALLSLFAEDAAFVSDSGGKSPAARRVLAGPDRIMRFLTGLERKWRGLTTHRIATLNGEPAVLTLINGMVFAATTFASDGERIHRVYRMMNPDRLGHVGIPPLGEVGRTARPSSAGARGSHTADK
jgi:RNA polymerase sigma-70 factor (ECF subfamily)